jgi:hypothetical protein
MHFDTKNYLKSTYNHTAKHTAMLCEAIKLLKKNLNFPLITDLGKIEEFFKIIGVMEASKMLFFFVFLKY